MRLSLIHICVVGGGDTALGDAVFLAKICKSVTVIHRRDTFRAAKHSVAQAEQLETVSYTHLDVYKRQP